MAYWGTMKRLCQSWRGFRAAAGGAIVLLTLLAGPVAQAGIVLGEQNWDTDPATGIGSWTTAGNAATLTLNDDLDDNWLQITFPGDVDPEPGDHWNETIYMPAADLYVGDWNTNMWITFDFWAETTVPAALQVRWYGEGGDTEWGYPLTGATIGQWTRFTAPLANWADWQISPFVDVNHFLNDLESINWIGIYLERDGYLEPEIYGIDDFALMVPEPAEVILLLAGIAAVGWSIRKRRPATATVTVA